jgi:hypothetical protein
VALSQELSEKLSGPCCLSLPTRPETLKFNSGLFYFYYGILFFVDCRVAEPATVRQILAFLTERGIDIQRSIARKGL